MKKETKQEITLIIIIIISLAFLIGCAIQPIIERDRYHKQFIEKCYGTETDRQ